MSYDNLSSVSQNVLKFYQQLTGEERRIPFILDGFHFCRSRFNGLDMTENRNFTLCHVKAKKICVFPNAWSSKLGSVCWDFFFFFFIKPTNMLLPLKSHKLVCFFLTTAY